MTTEIYYGTREHVLINGAPLPIRHDLNHLADHFDWNCEPHNPGMEQLALAILAYHCRSDEQRALSHYHEFKCLIIEHIPSEKWLMDRDYIEAILRTLEHSQQQAA